MSNGKRVDFTRSSSPLPAADIPHDLTTNFEVQLLNYMDKLNLLSTDAHILTIAARLGIMDIASLDKDFLRITRMGFNIYTAAALG